MGPEDTKKRIIDTAMELFSKNGYSCTTTRSIAEIAGVNELTIFRNFETKEGLLSAVIDQNLDLDDIKDQLPMKLKGTPEEDLFSLVSMIRMNLRKRSAIYRLAFREITTNPVVSKKLARLPILVKGEMVSQVRRILGNGCRDEVNIETASVFFLSYFIRGEMMRIILGKDPFHDIDDERTREAIDIFLNGVRKEVAG
jgi:AcrR family transcriptional regulator